ncbi:MAG: aspartate/glutamate racemase family protein [Candidatus Heimdallarchaeaceae archaeon]
MKKIGIIGGLSAESTIEYYKILLKEYNKIKGGASSPLLIIDSLDLEPMRNWMEDKEWEKVINEIKNSAKNLENAGAEAIIIATNTVHMFFEDIVKTVSVPMISILEATAEAVKAKGIRKVGLLGTIFTMQSDFYQKAFRKHNLEIIVPEQKDQEFINQVIWDELTHHIITEESKKGYLEVIKRLQDRGAQGVILGCTEIPLLIQQEDSPTPVFDTTTIHALATLKFALT